MDIRQDKLHKLEVKILVDNGCDIVKFNFKFGKLGFGTDLYFVAIDFENKENCKIATFEDFYEGYDHFKSIVINK